MNPFPRLPRLPRLLALVDSCSARLGRSAALLSLVLAAACGGAESGSADPGSSGGTSGGPSSGGPPPSSSGDSGANNGGDSGGGDSGTPPTKPVRFVAMGDTGTGSPGQYKIANTISAVCKARGCDFVQLLGDNIYQSGASSVDDPVWDEMFETPYAAIELDFYAVLGNHDYGHDGLGTDTPKGKVQVDYTAKSQKWKMPAAYYRHTKQNVEFFGLDTNEQMFSRDAAQRTDMKNWIAASTATWKIAFGHHPIKSNGPHGNAGSYDAIGGVISFPPVNGIGVKRFMDDVICGKVDLYFSGHDHSRQWLNVSCGGTELAVSGAGAKTTEFEGNNPSLFQSLELGFLYIVVDGKKLTAEFIDEEGQVEFSHVVNKP